MQLTQQEKRIKIAEACGIDIAAVREREGQNCSLHIPDYFADLNACADMRKSLKDGDQKARYVEGLCEVCGVGFIDDYHFLVDLVDATAEQHAEAFGTTLNLW